MMSLRSESKALKMYVLKIDNAENVRAEKNTLNKDLTY